MEVTAIGAAASFSLADVNFDEDKVKDGSQCNCMSMMTLLLVAAAAILAVLSMAIEGSSIVTVAGIISLVVTPVVLVQRYQLSRMSTLRQVHNRLRHDVNRLTSENADLEHQTARLSEKAERVKIVETNLQKMVGTQGGTVDSFVALVKDNGAILEEMNSLLTAQVAQQLMATIVRVDHDQNFQLSDKEISELIMRLAAMKGVDTIDEQQLRKVLSQSNGVEGVYSVIQNLQDSKQKSMIQVSSRALVF